MYDVVLHHTCFLRITSAFYCAVSFQTNADVKADIYNPLHFCIQPHLNAPSQYTGILHHAAPESGSPSPVLPYSLSLPLYAPRYAA